MIMDDQYTSDSPQQASLALQQAINYQAPSYHPPPDLVWALPPQYQVPSSPYESYTNSHLEYIPSSPTSFHPSNIQRHPIASGYSFPTAGPTSRIQSNPSHTTPSPAVEAFLRGLPQASTSGSTNHLRPPRFRPQSGVTVIPFTGRISQYYGH